ncbi:MAG: ABC transporter ATP-binding protein [Sphingobacteriaceae bacterium]|nr:ABC transporter ATP-binding protein [Sphingobacteriaceae bacterium]
MKNLKVLNTYFIKYKWHFLGGLLFVILSSIFKIYQGVIVREGTEQIMSVFKSDTPVESSVFLKHGLTLISLALLSGFFLFLMRQTIIVMSRHIEYDQKNELYQKYQELDQQFYKSHTTGDLMNRISEDVSKVRMYTGPAIMYLANTIVTTITILGFMLMVNVKLTLMVFIPLPILSLIIYFVSDKINKQGTIVQEELGNLTTQAQESFSAIRVIKAYAREKFFIKQMSEKSGEYRKAALRMANIEALFSPAMILMVGMSVLITVWYGGIMVSNGEISSGNIPEFILYVFYMTWPFAALGWVTSLIQRASASQKRINEFLTIKPNIISVNSNNYEIRGDIEFKNVTFKYPENGVLALTDLSFKLPAGKILGITGPVGSGKSSVISLLTRQYDVTEGEIWVDGKNIKEHNLKTLRRHMGTVTQDVFLFSDSIANNICFGTQEKQISHERIIDSAKKAGVHENIMQFPEQYETKVGERGVTLSGGQKQRISIARALIGNPKLLLFDDCLSAVDTETEELILSNIKKELQSRTGIIISHRLSSIKQADFILFLKDGKIAESGTHEELMKMRKDYFELNQLQNN